MKLAQIHETEIHKDLAELIMQQTAAVSVVRKCQFRQHYFGRKQAHYTELLERHFETLPAFPGSEKARSDLIKIDSRNGEHPEDYKPPVIQVGNHYCIMLDQARSCTYPFEYDDTEELINQFLKYDRLYYIWYHKKKKAMGKVRDIDGTITMWKVRNEGQ